MWHECGWCYKSLLPICQEIRWCRRAWGAGSRAEGAAQALPFLIMRHLVPSDCLNWNYGHVLLWLKIKAEGKGFLFGFGFGFVLQSPATCHFETTDQCLRDVTSGHSQAIWGWLSGSSQVWPSGLAPQVVTEPPPALPPGQVSCSATAGLKFLIIWEWEAPRFHFALGPVNYVARPAFNRYTVLDSGPTVVALTPFSPDLLLSSCFHHPDIAYGHKG